MTAPQVSPDPLQGSAPRYPLAPLIAAMGLSWNQACEKLKLTGTTRKKYRDDDLNRSGIAAARAARKAAAS